jgi:hypothetical protein
VRDRKGIEKGSKLHVHETERCVSGEVPKAGNRQSKRTSGVDPEGGESETSRATITRERSVSK